MNSTAHTKTASNKTEKLIKKRKGKAVTLKDFSPAPIYVLDYSLMFWPI
jgi:hypothetical protein